MKDPTKTAFVIIFIRLFMSHSALRHLTLSPPTLSPPNKFSSAKFLVCFNFQSAPMWLKVGENVAQVSNTLDPGETLSYLASRYWASHPAPR